MEQRSKQKKALAPLRSAVGGNGILEYWNIGVQEQPLTALL
jgi:hypothetical protein